MKVLLSDSNLITSSKIASQLKAQGWEVFSASRWKKAKDILTSNPDIGVAVINLEGFGGMEVLENLKKERQDIRVIAYCGHKNIRLQERARNVGIEAIVPNSVAVSSIVDLIKKVTS
jgi:DNA-binding NarL/FixJ family response regulator